MKILILKPSSLGDIIQALPVLRLLKLHLRDAEIFWWVNSKFAPLLEDDPDLAGLVLFQRERWTSPLHWPEMVRSIRWTRAQQFDWVIDLQGLLRSAIFAWLARGRLLIGLDNPREGGREGASGFYDLAVSTGQERHAVGRYLSVLSALGVPKHMNFQWLPERAAAAETVCAKWPQALTNPLSPWIALQPGARWPTKCWPVENFAELVRLFAQKIPDVHFAVMGGAADKPLGDVISRTVPERALNLCGETTLPEMIEWLRLCRLMITNDTGPMHAAAALGVPVVALFGPTDPSYTGPYGQLENVMRIDLPCAPCFKSSCRWKNPMECLTAISPEAVFRFAEKKLRSA
ncbi:MAG TPA: lipopolysaccharide heptosyltransferase II [Verrucomicrobiae bacterium]|nr:lipopolysaccharide heptosyltransferase II [Verrucomicrobiae bacterium]